MTGDDCKVCGGEGWLPSLPEGKSDCPYCNGTGKELEPNLRGHRNARLVSMQTGTFKAGE